MQTANGGWRTRPVTLVVSLSLWVFRVANGELSCSDSRAERFLAGMAAPEVPVASDEEALFEFAASLDPRRLSVGMPDRAKSRVRDASCPCPPGCAVRHRALTIRSTGTVDPVVTVQRPIWESAMRLDIAAVASTALAALRSLLPAPHSPIDPPSCADHATFDSLPTSLRGRWSVLESSVRERSRKQEPSTSEGFDTGHDEESDTDSGVRGAGIATAAPISGLSRAIYLECHEGEISRQLLSR